MFRPYVLHRQENSTLFRCETIGDSTLVSLSRWSVFTVSESELHFPFAICTGGQAYRHGMAYHVRRYGEALFCTTLKLGM